MIFKVDAISDSTYIVQCELLKVLSVTCSLPTTERSKSMCLVLFYFILSLQVSIHLMNIFCYSIRRIFSKVDTTFDQLFTEIQVVHFIWAPQDNICATRKMLFHKFYLQNGVIKFEIHGLLINKNLIFGEKF